MDVLHSYDYSNNPYKLKILMEVMRLELPIIGAKSSYLNDHAGRSQKLAVFDF